MSTSFSEKKKLYVLHTLHFCLKISPMLIKVCQRKWHAYASREFTFSFCKLAFSSIQVYSLKFFGVLKKFWWISSVLGGALVDHPSSNTQTWECLQAASLGDQINPNRCISGTPFGGHLSMALNFWVYANLNFQELCKQLCHELKCSEQKLKPAKGQGSRT